MIEFTDHAKAQLKRRKISQKSVLLVVRKPEKILASFRDRKLRQKTFGGNILEVVTKTEGSKIMVITAYYLRAKKDEN